MPTSRPHLCSEFSGHPGQGQTHSQGECAIAAADPRLISYLLSYLLICLRDRDNKASAGCKACTTTGKVGLYSSSLTLYKVLFLSSREMYECRVDMYGENAGDGMNAPETWEGKIVCVCVCVCGHLRGILHS